MEQQEPKFIVEIRKDYQRLPDGQFVDGTWEVAKDEFGSEMVFDYYFQAYRELEARCPAIKMLGANVGRVKEVEMITRRREEKKDV